jgi:UDP-glucuronate 4-epimerase
VRQGEAQPLKQRQPLQPGDVPDTPAEVEALTRGYRPIAPFEEGVKRFVEWYRSYYRPEVA